MDVEVCEKPDDGDPVTWVSMHILQWEKLCHDYDIDTKSLRLSYEREVEGRNNG